MFDCSHRVGGREDEADAEGCCSEGGERCLSTVGQGDCPSTKGGRKDLHGQSETYVGRVPHEPTARYALSL